MANLTLYHASPSRSSIVLWMLEEVGQPYDIKLLKLSARATTSSPTISPSIRWARCRRSSTATPSSPKWRRSAPISPMNFRKKLNVPVGTPRRGVYLKWLFFGPGCMEPAVIDRAAPRKEEARRAMLGYGDFDTTMNVVAKAVAKGPWLMGEQFTAADVVIGSQYPLGHDVQADPGAQGIRRLLPRALRRARRRNAPKRRTRSWPRRNARCRCYDALRMRSPPPRRRSRMAKARAIENSRSWRRRRRRRPASCSRA